MRAECFSKHGLSKTVVRSRKKLWGLRKAQFGSVRGQREAPSCSWQVLGAVSAPSSAVVSGLFQLSLLADSAGWAALIRHAEQQERQPLLHKLHRIAGLRYSFSLLLLLWEQELTCVPWSPDIHPTLGRRGRCIPTPWQCLCDPLRAAPVLLYFGASALTVGRKGLPGGLPALPGAEGG